MSSCAFTSLPKRKSRTSEEYDRLLKVHLLSALVLVASWTSSGLYPISMPRFPIARSSLPGDTTACYRLCRFRVNLGNVGI